MPARHRTLGLASNSNQVRRFVSSSRFRMRLLAQKSAVLIADVVALRAAAHARACCPHRFCEHIPPDANVIDVVVEDSL